MSNVATVAIGSGKLELPQKAQAVAARSQTAEAKAPARLDAAAIGEELKKLASSAAGLTAAEAQERLKKYGLNAIKAHEESRWRKLLGYFWGPIPWMIEAAALISLFREDWPDFAIVTGLLLYNAAVGFWQDNKAANALAALKKGLALKARVRRDSAWITIDAADIVPGDIVNLSGGDRTCRSSANRWRVLIGRSGCAHRRVVTSFKEGWGQRLFGEYRQTGRNDRRRCRDRQ
jgi:H+-transporting ATPase